MFGFKKRTFSAPWYIPALANLIAAWAIYRIARSFTRLAGRSAGAGKDKKKIKHGKIKIAKSF